MKTPKLFISMMIMALSAISSFHVQADCLPSFAASVNGLTVSFNNTSNNPGFPVDFAWSFGDGNSSTDINPIHTYANAGDYYVCMAMVDSTGNPCGYFCDSVTVGGNNPCQAYFTWTPGNAPDNIIFYNQSSSSGTSFYYWSFGDGDISSMSNPDHTYPAPGTYVACLTVYNSNGCQNTYCDTIAINPFFSCVDTTVIDPNVVCPALYNPVCGCDGVTYANDCEAYYHHGVTSWTMGACGSSVCEADYTWSANGNTIYFNNTSINTGLNPTYSWLFGDGSTSNDVNPVHTYSQGGYYQVCIYLYVDNQYCDSTCHEIYVGVNGSCIDTSVINIAYLCPNNYNPVCGCNGVTYDNECIAYYHNGVTSWTPGLCNAGGNCEAYFTWSCDSLNGGSNTVYFTYQSAGTTPNTTYYWTFGDSTTSTDQNPNHIYSGPGYYYVCLTISVLNSNGTSCTSQHCSWINVCGNTNCIDQSVIDPNVVCPQVYDPVCGCDGVTYYNECEAYYHHGVTSWVAGPCNNGGCQAEFTWTIAGNSVYFTNLSQGGVTYYWSFGDFNTSQDTDPYHTYMQTGTYHVCLFVLDYLGGICDSTCHDITVGQNTGPCTADFSYTVSGDTVTFTDNSTGANGWYWYFGDSTFATDQNPIHVYPGPGIYVVCEGITMDSLGVVLCTAYHCDTIEVGSNATSIETLKQVKANVDVFPNPFKDETNIILNIDHDATVSWNIVNLLGEVIEQHDAKAYTAGRYTFTWNAMNASAGVYLLQFDINGKIYSHRMSVAK